MIHAVRLNRPEGVVIYCGKSSINVTCSECLLELIKSKPYLIQSIQNPSEELFLLAYKEDNSILHYHFHNFSEELLEKIKEMKIIQDILE